MAKKKGSAMNIPGQLMYIGKEVAKDYFSEYTDSLSSLVDDGKEILDAVTQGKSKIVDVFNDIKQNGGKKALDWFMQRSDETSMDDLNDDGLDSDFDAGFQVGDDDDSEEESHSHIYEDENAKKLARGQVNAMYQIGAKQAEVSMINASEIVSHIDSRSSEIIASLSQVNKSIIGIGEKIDAIGQLMQTKAEVEERARKERNNGMFDSSGRVTLGSFFKTMTKSVSDAVNNSMVASIFKQKELFTPAGIISMLLSDTKEKELGKLGGWIGGGLDRLRIGNGNMAEDLKTQTIDSIGNELNKTLGNMISDLFTGGMQKSTDLINEKLNKIPGGMFMSSIFSGIVNDVTGAKRDRIGEDHRSEIENHYNRETAKFDGIVRQTIVEIIPDYLRAITKALTGKDYHVNTAGHLSDQRQDYSLLLDNSLFQGNLMNSQANKRRLTNMRSNYRELESDMGFSAGMSNNEKKRRMHQLEQVLEANDSELMSAFTEQFLWYCEDHRIAVVNKTHLEDDKLWSKIQSEMLNYIADIGNGRLSEYALKYWLRQLRKALTAKGGITNYSNDASDFVASVNRRLRAITDSDREVFDRLDAVGQGHHFVPRTKENTHQAIQSQKGYYREEERLSREKEKMLEQFRESKEYEDAKKLVKKVGGKVVFDPTKKMEEKKIEEWEETNKDVIKKNQDLYKSFQENLEKEEVQVASLNEQFKGLGNSFDILNKNLSSVITTKSGIEARNGISIGALPRQFHLTLFKKMDVMIDRLGVISKAVNRMAPPEPLNSVSGDVPPVVFKNIYGGAGEDDETMSDVDRMKAEEADKIMVQSAQDGDLVKDIPFITRLTAGMKNRKMAQHIKQTATLWGTALKQNSIKDAAKAGAESVGDKKGIGGGIMKIIGVVSMVGKYLIGKVGKFLGKFLVKPLMGLAMKGFKSGWNDIKKGFSMIFNKPYDEAAAHKEDISESKKQTSLLERLINSLTGHWDEEKREKMKEEGKNPDEEEGEKKEKKSFRERAAETWGNIKAMPGKIGNTVIENAGVAYDTLARAAKGSRDKMREQREQREQEKERLKGLSREERRAEKERIKEEKRAAAEAAKQSNSEDAPDAAEKPTLGGLAKAGAGKALGGIGKAIGGVLGAVKRIGGGMLSIGKGILKIVLTAVASLSAIKVLTDLVSKTVAKSVQPLNKGLKVIINKLKPVIKTFGTVIGAIAGTLTKLITQMSPFIGKVTDMLSDILAAALPLVDPLLGCLTVVADCLEPILDLIEPTLPRIAGAVTILVGIVQGGFAAIEFAIGKILVGIGSISEGLHPLSGKSKLTTQGEDLLSKSKEGYANAGETMAEGWNMLTGKSDGKKTTTTETTSSPTPVNIPSPTPSTGAAVDAISGSGDEDGGTLQEQLSPYFHAMIEEMHAIRGVHEEYTKPAMESQMTYEDSMLKMQDDYIKRERMISSKVLIPMYSTMKNDVAYQLESIESLQKVQIGNDAAYYGQALGAAGLQLIAAGQQAAGAALFQTSIGLAAAGMVMQAEGSTSKANTASYFLTGKPFNISSLYEEPASSTSTGIGSTPVEETQTTETEPTTQDTTASEIAAVETPTTTSTNQRRTREYTPDIDRSKLGDLNTTINTSDVREYLGIQASGDSQGSYGSYLNMSKRGCGPVALADAANRRGRNVNAGALAGSMASSGTYSSSRGTSVGGFLSTAASMGMGYTPGGVTSQSLGRATPNNPITLVGSGAGFGTRAGNTHYINVIGTDHAGGAYVSNPLSGRVERRSANELASSSVLGLYGSGDISYIPGSVFGLYGSGDEIQISYVKSPVDKTRNQRQYDNVIAFWNKYNLSTSAGSPLTHAQSLLNDANNTIKGLDLNIQKFIHNALMFYFGDKYKTNRIVDIEDAIILANKIEALWYNKHKNSKLAKQGEWEIDENGNVRESLRLLVGNITIQEEDPNKKYTFTQANSKSTANLNRNKKTQAANGISISEAEKWYNYIVSSNAGSAGLKASLEAAYKKYNNQKSGLDSTGDNAGTRQYWWYKNALIYWDDFYLNAKRDQYTNTFAKWYASLSEKGTLNSVKGKYWQRVANGIASGNDYMLADVEAEAATAEAGDVSTYSSASGSSAGVAAGVSVSAPPGGRTGYVNTEQKYAHDSTASTIPTVEGDSFAERMKSAMSGLKNVFSNILNLFSTNEDQEVTDTLETDKNAKMERVIREAIGNEEYDEYMNQAFELYKKEHPRYETETDEKYQIRIKNAWEGNEDIRRKYFLAVTKNNANVMNAMKVNGLYDATEGSASTIYGEYDPETGEWSGGLLNASLGGTSGSIVDTSYNDPYAGKFVSDGGAVMWTDQYQPTIFETNITEDGGATQSNSPIHEFFLKTAGLTNGEAFDYSFSADGNWYVKRNTPNKVGEGSVGEDHRGVDILNYPNDKMQSGKAELHAITSGTVTDVRYSGEGNANSPYNQSTDSGWGNSVQFKDAGGVFHRYAHMRDKPTVNIGDTINAGDILGVIGNTGNSTGEHVHYQIQSGDGSEEGSTFLNPLTYFKYHQPTGTATGALQGEIPFEGITGEHNAWNAWEKNYHDQWPDFIKKGANAGMTPAEIAVIASMGIWEDNARKFFGDKSLTATTHDGSGQRAEGIMNWVEKGVAGNTLEEQLKYVKDRYWRMTPMAGKESSGTYREGSKRDGGEGVFKDMTKRTTGFTLNVGDRYADLMNRDMIEGSTYYYQGDLAPAKAYTASGLADYVGTAIGMYNWLLQNGYTVAPSSYQTNAANNAAQNAADPSQIGTGQGGPSDYDTYSDKDNNMGIIWNYLRNNLGYSEEASAGVMGNLEAESGYYPMATLHHSKDDFTKKLVESVDRTHTWEGADGPFGIAQWLDGRRDNLLKKSIADNKSIVNLPMQLEFIKQELESSESKTHEQMKSIGGVQDAADYWRLHFERCGQQLMDRRRTSAQEAYSKFKGTNGGAVNVNGGQFGSAAVATRPEDTLWINTLHRAIKATDDAGLHSYVYGGSTTVELDGKTIHGRPDCTGLIQWPLSYLGYDLGNIQSDSLVEASSSNKNPIKKDGENSPNFEALKWGSEVNADTVVPGDIVVRNGHGEIAYGKVGDSFKVWNYGSDDSIVATQKVASQVLGGTSLSDAASNLPGAEHNGSSGAYAYAIRPTGELSVGVNGASASGAATGGMVNGYWVGKFPTAANWAAKTYGYGGSARNSGQGKGFSSYAFSSIGGISNFVNVNDLGGLQNAAATGAGNGNLAVGAFVDALTKTQIAADEQGMHSYDNNEKSIELEGRTLTGRPDCSGMVMYAADYLGYDNGNIQSTTLVNASKKTKHPIKKDGEESEDWTAYKWQDEIKAEDLQMGDIVARDINTNPFGWTGYGHVEVVGGVKDGHIWGWNYGGDDAIIATQKAAHDIANGKEPLQALMDNNDGSTNIFDGSQGINQSNLYNIIIRPTQSLTATNAFAQNGTTANTPGTFTNSSLADASYLITTPRKTDKHIHSGPRPGGITKMTWHTWSNSQGDALSDLKSTFASRADEVAKTNPNGRIGVSSTYGIDGSGKIGLFVDEGNIPHTSSSPENDQQAVTIEIANKPEAYTRYKNNGDESWEISDAAMEAAKKLTVDVAKRNGISKFTYTGDPSGSWTYHRMFANKSCPGDYIVNQTDSILADINKRISGSGDEIPIPPIDQSKIASTINNGSMLDGLMDDNNMTNNTTNIIVAKSTQKENEMIERMMNHTFNVRAEQVEILLQQILDKMDNLSNKTSTQVPPTKPQNQFTNNDIPKQIQRLARG
jgi:murein DD-endopeptidase MepM/ murein hydrolase activator NlpD